MLHAHYQGRTVNIFTSSAINVPALNVSRDVLQENEISAAISTVSYG